MGDEENTGAIARLVREYRVARSRFVEGVQVLGSANLACTHPFVYGDARGYSTLSPRALETPLSSAPPACRRCLRSAGIRGDRLIPRAASFALQNLLFLRRDSNEALKDLLENDIVRLLTKPLILDPSPGGWS